MPANATSASSAIWPNASSVMAATLPASRARTGTLDTRISTIRVCFSSMTLWAICRPYVYDVMKKSIARIDGIRNSRNG